MRTEKERERPARSIATCNHRGAKALTPGIIVLPLLVTIDSRDTKNPTLAKLVKFRMNIFRKMCDESAYVHVPVFVPSNFIFS